MPEERKEAKLIPPPKTVPVTLLPSDETLKDAKFKDAEFVVRIGKGTVAEWEMETRPSIPMGWGYVDSTPVVFESKSRPVEPLIQQWVDSHTPKAQIEEIMILATTILDDKDQAVKWLSQPNAATDNRPPIELIGEEQGYERVKNLLLRIEHGVLA